MIGDPLINHEQPITPPGVRHPNEVYEFVRVVLIVIGVIILVLGTVAWFWAVSPDDPCEQEVNACQIRTPAG